MSRAFGMIVLVICAAFVTVVSTEAQQGQGGMGKGKGMSQQFPKAVKMSGSIKSVQNDVISMAGTGGNEALVQLTPQTSVTVEGTASPDALANGMAVEFKAHVTKKGEITGEVDKLEVRDSNDTNFKQGAFTSEDPDNPLKTLKDRESMYVIRGKLRTVKDHEIIVTVPGAPPLHGKVASDARVSVVLTSAGLAHAGDTIMLEGKAVQYGKIVAEKVVIKLAKPLEGKKKPGAPSKAPAASPSTPPFGASGS